MTPKPLNDHLIWRYATKKMDPAKAVPQEKVDAIIEAIRMAPTSSGTQPFELIVVTNAHVRGQIAEAAGGQAQITDGSHCWFSQPGTTTLRTELTTWFN